MAHSQGKRIAVVGSGCAGLAAVWALKSTDHDVFLYESAGRLGGHTNTVQWKSGKYTTAVDTGFVVLDEATYPNFLAFLNAVDVPLEPTDMALAVSRDGGLFEWAGTTLSIIFWPRCDLFFPRFWRMLFDVVRFNYFALDIFVEEDETSAAPTDSSPASGYRASAPSIGEYLEREGYSRAFRDGYLVPLISAIWCVSPDGRALEFPAATLVRFLSVHRLLSMVPAKPKWLTLKHCGQSYVEAVMKDFPEDRVFLNTPVRSLANDPSGRVRLLLEDGSTAVYDHVILATHGDQARSIVRATATPDEDAILSSFKTSPNRAVLHSDTSLLPRRASPTCAETDHASVACLTYDMNALQHIPRATFGDVLVTLNPVKPPSPETVQGEFTYSHPLYTPEAACAQGRLAEIQGSRGVSYAGAWTGWGFHEDACTSGLLAAERLGARVPFEARDSVRCRVRPDVGVGEWVARAVISLVQRAVVVTVERVVERVVDRVLGPGREEPYGDRKKRV